MSASSLSISPGSLTDPAPLPDAPGGCLLVTDDHVEPLIPEAWAGFARHVIAPGEGSKTWEGLGGLLHALDRAGIDRDGLVLAVGGGVVTDLAGLGASLHRRGVRWVAVPTSVVGQVDAAVGGKTAVNLGGGKNTVGSFHPAIEVRVDPRALSSLPDVHLRAGMAEVLKTALIAGGELYERMADLAPEDLRAGGDQACAVVDACLTTKLSLVEGDLHDRGERRKLNLGHTFGHAFEALCLDGPGRAAGLHHGQAVGLGLICAARLTAGEPDAALEVEVRERLGAWGLPTRVDLDPTDVLAEMARDKKREGGGLVCVLVHHPGRVTVRADVPAAAVEAALGAVLGQP